MAEEKMLDIPAEEKKVILKQLIADIKRNYYSLNIQATVCKSVGDDKTMKGLEDKLSDVLIKLHGFEQELEKVK